MNNIPKKRLFKFLKDHNIIIGIALGLIFVIGISIKNNLGIFLIILSIILEVAYLIVVKNGQKYNWN